MLRLDIRTRFNRDMKRVKKRGKNMDRLRIVVNDLQAGRRLAQKHKPHLLTAYGTATWNVTLNLTGC